MDSRSVFCPMLLRKSWRRRGRAPIGRVPGYLFSCLDSWKDGVAPGCLLLVGLFDREFGQRQRLIGGRFRLVPFPGGERLLGFGQSGFGRSPGRLGGERLRLRPPARRRARLRLPPVWRPERAGSASRARRQEEIERIMDEFPDRRWEYRCSCRRGNIRDRDNPRRRPSAERARVCDEQVEIRRIEVPMLPQSER